MKDKEVINKFVEHLQNNGYPNLKVDCWPDEENRNFPDIDAIAGRFAIEHTSIDTIEDQRSDSSLFMEAVGKLEKEISLFEYRLRITIPYEGIRKGLDFKNIKEGFRTWILNDSKNLSDGRHKISNAVGIPFNFSVGKASDRPAGLKFRRSESEDKSSIYRQKQLERKVKKLAPYKKKGKTTILLVESSDMALMNEDKMIKYLQTAFGNNLPTDIDQIWYADTSIPSEIWFHDFTNDIQKDGN
ncbi:MAG: hypothetical protein ABH873_10115 [Candidatus Firestonebacteria bacterium]